MDSLSADISLVYETDAATLYGKNKTQSSENPGGSVSSWVLLFVGHYGFSGLKRCRQTNLAANRPAEQLKVAGPVVRGKRQCRPWAVRSMDGEYGCPPQRAKLHGGLHRKHSLDGIRKLAFSLLTTFSFRFHRIRIEPFQ